MKIVVDLRCLMGSPWSGVPVYTRELLSAATPLDTTHAWSGWCAGRSGAQPVIDGIASCVVIRRSNMVNTMLWSLPWSSGLVNQAPDVYFLPNWNIVPSRLNAPVVLTVHDLWILRAGFDGSLKERLWHRSIQITRLLKRVDRIIAVSHATAEELAVFFPSVQSKIRIVPLASPSTYAQHSCDALCQQWRTTPPYIVALTDHHRRKNIDTLLESMAQAPRGTHLVIVGATKPKEYQNVRWLGVLSGNAYHAVLAHATALCYPSWYEGYGFPPHEALERGIPVMVGGNPAVMESMGSRAIVVNPFDRASVRRGLQEVFVVTSPKSQPSSRRWSDVARETMRVLEEVA